MTQEHKVGYNARLSPWTERQSDRRVTKQTRVGRKLGDTYNTGQSKSNKGVTQVDECVCEARPHGHSKFYKSDKMTHVDEDGCEARQGGQAADHEAQGVEGEVQGHATAAVEGTPPRQRCKGELQRLYTRCGTRVRYKGEAQG